MRMIELIKQKRDGGELTTAQINWFVRAYTHEEIPDYQASALMMAIFIRGMNRRETVDLTLAMAASGEQLDLHDVTSFVVDKHSSGGVGDKTTLVVQPVVAACGVPVGKMSGHGLGSSGGTLDKMETISGWSCDLSLAQFKQQLREIGMVLAGQTVDLAPADGKLYALRDVTGTVANDSLIAASIMSKKLASGADGIVLDVKAGSGAFMATPEAARELAQLMVDIGKDAGRQMTAVVSDMNQPLGTAVGNALEVKEAIATLQGEGDAHLWAHSQIIAAHMLHLAGKAASLEEAQQLVDAVRQNGEAFAKFRQLVIAQGGDVRQVDDVAQLPQARLVAPIKAPQGGYLAAVDTGAIGWACVRLGAGRMVKTDILDHAVGLLLPTKVGDRVEAGQTVGVIHANDEEKLKQAHQEILAALTWSEASVTPLPHIYDVVQ